MSGSNEKKYVWVMEWTWPFHSDDWPSRSYESFPLEVQPGVCPEDIEKFMIDEVFPAVGARPTRAGWVVKHYLLKQNDVLTQHAASIHALSSTISYIRDESIQAKFESLVTSSENLAFALVGTWEAEE